MKATQPFTIPSARCGKSLRRPVLIATVASLLIAAQALAGSADDRTLAHRIAPRVTDFESGWSEVPGSGSSGCFDRPLVAQRPTAYVNGHDLSQGESGPFEESTVAVYATAANAKRALTALLRSGPFACYRRYLATTSGGKDVRFVSFTGGRMSFDPVNGDLHAFRYSQIITANGTRERESHDYLFVRRGRVIISVFYESPTNDWILDYEHDDLAKALARTPGY